VYKNKTGFSFTLMSLLTFLLVAGLSHSGRLKPRLGPSKTSS